MIDSDGNLYASVIKRVLLFLKRTGRNSILAVIVKPPLCVGPGGYDSNHSGRDPLGKQGPTGGKQSLDGTNHGFLSATSECGHERGAGLTSRR